MTTINKIVCDWSGWQGAPAQSAFYVTGTVTTATLDDIHGFFYAVRSLFNGSLSWACQTSGVKFDDSDGIITGTWSATPTDASIGASGGSSVFSASAGACVTWRTGVYVVGASGRSRELRGRTFLVPLAASCYATDGTLDNTVRTTILGAGAGLISNLSGALHAWKRPVGPIPGVVSVVTSATCTDQGAVLRSRR